MALSQEHSESEHKAVEAAFDSKQIAILTGRLINFSDAEREITDPVEIRAIIKIKTEKDVTRHIWVARESRAGIVLVLTPKARMLQAFSARDHLVITVDEESLSDYYPLYPDPLQLPKVTRAIFNFLYMSLSHTELPYPQKL